MREIGDPFNLVESFFLGRTSHARLHLVRGEGRGEREKEIEIEEEKGGRTERGRRDSDRRTDRQ